mgnify:CR=1 FL=1
MPIKKRKLPVEEAPVEEKAPPKKIEPKKKVVKKEAAKKTKPVTAGDLLTAFAEQTEGKDTATKAKLKIQLKKDLASLKTK